MLTQARLKELVTYDEDRGILLWNFTYAKCKLGLMAGGYDKNGYYIIRLDGIRYFGSRVIWLYKTGEWPDIDIDHKDLNTKNNKWNNLRKATDSQNNSNRRKPKNNTTGFKGIFAVANGKFIARIQVNKKKINLGTYDTKEKAYEAYKKCSQLLSAGFFEIRTTDDNG